MFAKHLFSMCRMSSNAINSRLPLPNRVLSLNSDLKQILLLVINIAPESKIFAWREQVNLSIINSPSMWLPNFLVSFFLDLLIAYASALGSSNSAFQC